MSYQPVGYIGVVSLTLFMLLGSSVARAQGQWDVMADTWAGSDSLGRTLLDADFCGSPRPNRTVALFYYMWHLDRAVSDPIYDISEILDGNQDFGPLGAPHYWARPELGYYRSDDPYVIRKHAAMLCNAGIDVIFFDATNNYTYTEMYTAILDEFQRIRSEGGCTPQIAFHATCTNAMHFYDDIYSPPNGAPPRYSDMWFYYEGRPFMLVLAAPPNPPFHAFFSFRQSDRFCEENPGGITGLPACCCVRNNPFPCSPSDPLMDCLAPNWTCGQQPPGWCKCEGSWSWMDRFPQPIAYRSPGVAEEISVSCAIHASSDAVPNVVGRSSYRGVQPGAPYDSHSGLFFRQQWNRARAADPAVIFVNSWNEWVAGKHILTSNPSIGCQAPECPVSCDDIQSGHCVGGSRYAEGRWLSPGEPFFVDEYTPEFSRDCEPVTGGFEDAYYYQLVNAVRRYKGVRRIGTPSASQSITIDGLFAEWGAVQPEYRDAVGDVMHRNWPSVSPAIVYNDSTGRNDIVVCKVARDSSNVYFYVRAQTALSQSTDSNWMLLFLNVDGSYDTGWNGYDYLVNRSVGSQTIADLSIWTPSGWTSVGSVSYRAASNELEIAIPRSALGLSPSDALRIDFKWADNIQSLTDVREFVLHGDSAPDRRFNYRYAEAAAFPGRTIVVDDDYHVESGAYQYPANELGSALMPYNTFAEGYAQAQPGDRMVVLPNTFSVGNRLDRPVRIESAGGRLLRLQP